MHCFSLAASLLAVLILLINVSRAAQGGPDAHGYTWADLKSGALYKWIDLSSTGSAVLTGNSVNAGNIELEVPWGGIYGQPVSEIRISRNGYITDLLTANGNDETNDCPLPQSPSVGAGGFRIYPLHDDLEMSDSGGRILYQYFSQSPHPLYACGVHVITWDQVYHENGNPTETFSFQALLFDNLDILFQYGPGNPEKGRGSTTGIQNADATIGLSITCNAAEIPDKFAILIQPPVTTVTTMEDEFDTPSGANVSLREAMRDTVDGGRIQFGSALANQTIHLSSAAGGQGSAISLTSKPLALDASNLGGKVHVHGGDVAHFLLNTESWLSLNNLYLEKGADSSVMVGNHSTLVACESGWVGNSRSAPGYGGAILMTGTSASAAFYACDFMSNSTTIRGGVIFADSDVGIHSLRAERCRFWRNKVFNTGGALYLRNVDSVRLIECDFATNEAQFGGAIALAQNVHLHAFGCTFDENRGERGGAVVFRSTGIGDSSALFHYCTFFQNAALQFGGALMEEEFASMLDLNAWHCTFYKNCAPSGGAFHLAEVTCKLAAVIMADNGSDQVAITGAGALNVAFGDNIETGNEGGFASSGLSDVTDIGLTDLGHFGGFVRTCLPLQHSPVIDRAIADNATSAIDARGFPTFRDGATLNPGSFASDVGAVELGPTAFFTGAGSLQNAINSVVEDGGVVVPTTGHMKFNATGLVTSLTIPTGKTIFLDASPVNRLQALNLNFTLDAGQNLGLYGVQTASDRANTNMVVASGSQLTMDRCRVSGYTIEDADLLSVDGSLSLSRTTICDTLVSRGSILNAEGGTVIVREATFAGGRQQDSATVIITDGGAAMVQRSSIVQNRLADSGGLAASAVGIRGSTRHPRAWGLCENTTISANVITDQFGAAESGGLTYFTAFFGESINRYGIYAEANSNTITGNQFAPANAASIHLQTVAEGFIELGLARNILAQNSREYANVGPGTTNVDSNRDNLSDTNPSFFTDNDIPDTDPLLGSLIVAKEGMLVHVPTPGSPCIDAGPNTVIPKDGGRDGRGNKRRIDSLDSGFSKPDIGAVETGRALLVTTELDEDDGSLGLGVGDSLRECIAEAVALGSGNIGFDPSLATLTLTSGTPFTIPNGFVDIHGAQAKTALTSTDTTFTCQAEAQLSLSRLSLTATGNDTMLDCSGNSHACVNQSDVIGFSFSSTISENASGALLDTQVIGQGSSGTVFVRDSGTVSIQNCLLDRNSGIELIRLEDEARAFAKRTTISRNRAMIVYLGSSPRIHFTECTATRNRYGIDANTEDQVLIDRSIFTNNTHAGESALIRDSSFISDRPENYRSLGGNLLDESLDRVTAHPTDIGLHAAYLAPLADANGDGIPEMQLLSASPVFNTKTGANTQPSEVLMVTTAEDQNDSPAGAEISLREAIRDISAGGTLIFDPSLNNATFKIGATLDLPQSMTIDATSLPLGIDLTTRLQATDGKRLALHGIHLRDINNTGQLGGAVSVSGSGSSFVASHCAFSHTQTTLGTVAASTGTLTLENCTFALNTHTNTSAVFLNNADADIQFCTFGQGTADAEVISGAGSVSLYANVFFGNVLADGTTPASSIKQPQVAVESLGANVFPDIPLNTTSDDVTGFTNIANVFYPFGNYDFGTAWVDSYQTLPQVGTPQDQTPSSPPPPEHDTRGVSRVFGASADAGAHENAGELVDTDGDELPDWWETQHGLNVNVANDPFEDSDGDGVDLATEYQWRTDPNNALSFFSIDLDPTSSGADIMISTQPGYGYLLETSTDMSGWKTADKFIGDGDVMTRAQSTDNTRRFWQLRFLP